MSVGIEGGAAAGAGSGTVMLLTCSTMMDVDGGTILFRRLLPYARSLGLVWGVAGGATRDVPVWASEFPRAVHASWLLGHRTAALFRRSPVRALWWWATHRWFARRAGRRLAGFARRWGVRKIWTHAGSTAVPAALELRRLTGLPLHVSVQDDVAGHRRPGDPSYVTGDFAELLRCAESLDVISEEMRVWYRERFDLGHDAAVIWTGGDGGPLPPAPETAERVTRIGYAGNLWAMDAIEVLIEALERLNQARAEAKIEVVVFAAARPRTHASPVVRYAGFFEPTALTSQLQTCDVLYAPMSFAPRYETLVRTSIPAKLLHYMQAQIPILAHGPAHATNVRFVRARGVGLASSATDPAALGQELAAYERDRAARRHASQRCRELFATEFGPAVVWSRLAPLLAPAEARRP